MPATSLSGDCIARRFFRRARRLALEVQHHEIARARSTGPEWKVAVNAGLLQHRLGFFQAAKGLQHLAASERQQQTHQLRPDFVRTVVGQPRLSMRLSRVAGHAGPNEISRSCRAGGFAAGRDAARCWRPFRRLEETEAGVGRRPAFTATSIWARCCGRAAIFVVLDFEGEPARSPDRTPRDAIAAQGRRRHGALLQLPPTPRWPAI